MVDVMLIRAEAGRAENLRQLRRGPGITRSAAGRAARGDGGVGDAHLLETAMPGVRGCSALALAFGRCGQVVFRVRTTDNRQTDSGYRELVRRRRPPASGRGRSGAVVRIQKCAFGS